MNKLFNLQNKIKAIKKDEDNPFYKSKYFDINTLIAELKPLLNEECLIVLQPLTHVEGKAALSTIVFDAEKGERLIESVVVLPENADPQKMGSIITYFRRYALQSLFLLEAADDDANSAINPPVAAPKYSQGGNGNCPKCQAPMVMSKAGSIYCSAVCWKNTGDVVVDKSLPF